MSPAASSISSSAEGTLRPKQTVAEAFQPLPGAGCLAVRSRPAPTDARRFAIGLAAGLALSLVVACGGDDKHANGVSVATTTPQTGAQTAATDKPVTSSSPTNPTGGATASNEPLSFATPDGVTIKGHFYSAPGAKRRALIIVSAGDQKTWGPYAQQLAGQGIALYTFDERGVGETGGAKNDAQLDKDIQVAVNLIKSRDYPLVYLFAVGSDPGIAAIKVAAREDLAGVAAFSAGAAARSDIANVKAPKLLMASANNADASAAVNTLAQASSSAKQVILASNPSASDPLSATDARQALIDFVLGK